MSFNPEILTILAGTTGSAGVLAIIVYLFVSQKLAELKAVEERSIRRSIEGDDIFNADQVILIIREFSTDEGRLKALIELAKVQKGTQKSAENLYNKIKPNISYNESEIDKFNRVTQLSRASSVGFVIMCATFITFHFINNNIESVTRPPLPHPTGSPTDEITPTPAPQKKSIVNTCRLPDFGQEGWNYSEDYSDSSGWVDGGRDQGWWCNQVAANFIQSRSIGPKNQWEKVTSGEEHKKDFLGHVTYKYSCTIRIKWDPKYVEKQDPRCGVTEE